MLADEQLRGACKLWPTRPAAGGPHQRAVRRAIASTDGRMGEPIWLLTRFPKEAFPEISPAVSHVLPNAEPSARMDLGFISPT